MTLPALGESVTEGTVTRWLKQVGDDVAVDEPLLEVSTDKVDTEIPSPVAGTLLEIKVDEDETVEVGAELAVIGDRRRRARPAAATSSPRRRSQAEQQAEPEPEPEQPSRSRERRAGARARARAGRPSSPPRAAAAGRAEPRPRRRRVATSRRRYVTPLVRKMAAQHDVDLAGHHGHRRRRPDPQAGRPRRRAQAGHGHQRRPSRRPPQRRPPSRRRPPPPAAAPSPGAPAPSPLRGTTEKMTRLRKVIAKRMVESLQVSRPADHGGRGRRHRDLAAARQREGRLRAARGREAVVHAVLRQGHDRRAQGSTRALNAAIDTEKGEVTYYDRENLAIAVDTEKGLLTPVIKDAGDLSIAGLARKIADVAERTRTNKITPDELSGGTFTLTNTGSRGALFDTPIINQPQVAILGTGAVVKRPVVIDDPNLGETIAVRQMVYLALTYDHRLVDGADAARFLGDVKARLEAGQFEV